MTRAFAGVDVGGQSMKAALVDEHGKVLDTDRVETGAGMSPADLSAAVDAVLARFSSKASVGALGCGIAGCVTLGGILKGCPNLPALCDVPLEEILEKSTGLPASVDNDAHCHALAEGWTGAAAGLSDFLLVALGSGLGSGLVLSGRVHRGETGYGCELGHMILRAAGRRCACGNLGCFEAYASEMGLRAAVAEADAEFARRVAARVAAEEEGHAAALFGMADEGDAAAVRTVDEFVEMLGTGLASAVNVFDVTTLVLGGGIAPGVVRRMPALRRALDAALFARSETAVAVLPASAGPLAGAVGAARLAMLSL